MIVAQISDTHIVGPDKLRGLYSKRENSGLSATVKAGDNQSVRFDLK